ncbi:hypothetical protein [Actinobacillus equuli]|nr:hypothetical protein [Actinobacillus equuli]
MQTVASENFAKYYGFNLSVHGFNCCTKHRLIANNFLAAPLATRLPI